MTISAEKLGSKKTMFWNINCWTSLAPEPYSPKPPQLVLNNAGVKQVSKAKTLAHPQIIREILDKADCSSWKPSHKPDTHIELIEGSNEGMYCVIGEWEYRCHSLDREVYFEAVKAYLVEVIG